LNDHRSHHCDFHNCSGAFYLLDMSYIPTRPFIPTNNPGTGSFYKSEIESARKAAEFSFGNLGKTESNPIKKKDPRTFIGWALKAFID